MNDWTLGEMAGKSLDELAGTVSAVSAAKPVAGFYTSELARRASLATIQAAEATKATAWWTKVSAIAIAFTFVATACGIVLSFYR